VESNEVTELFLRFGIGELMVCQCPTSPTGHDGMVLNGADDSIVDSVYSLITASRCTAEGGALQE
jgi:hypothetical protein